MLPTRVPQIWQKTQKASGRKFLPFLRFLRDLEVKVTVNVKVNVKVKVNIKVNVKVKLTVELLLKKMQ